MNEDELKILTRIANALEAIAQASAPAAPNYQFPFEEYATFDWSRIAATVTAADEYGATVVTWNGHTWKRRSWPQKYGLVVGFTRPDGMGEDGVNWLNLISFKEQKPVEALDSKVTQALAGRRVQAEPRQANGNGATVRVRRKSQTHPVQRGRSEPKAEPGTWDHVEAGSVANKKLADFRAAIEGQGKSTKLGFVVEKAAQAGLYANAQEALRAVKSWPDLPAGIAVTSSKSIKTGTAVTIFDWLATVAKSRQIVDDINGDLF
jgi:hypothetical protein